MEYYDHAMSGAVLALAAGVQRKFGPAIVLTAAASASLPDWDDLPGGVHRVWGHSLLIAPLASGLAGSLGYLCYRSARRMNGSGLLWREWRVWILIGVVASLTHVLGDLVYCGQEAGLDWPVVLFWPLTRDGWGLPTVAWADRGLTIILGTALVVACILRRHAQLIGVTAVVVAVMYIGVWGVARYF